MKTKKLVLVAMFAAMIAVTAQISVPIGIVPINMAHVGIFMSAGLLGPKLGTLSVLIYILLGIIGAPVFSGFRGGLAVVLGPTGGFILGYLLCSLVTGLVKWPLIGMTVGLVVNYFIGIPWLMFVTSMDLGTAMTVSVIPFLLGDTIKIILSAILVKRLKFHT